MARPKVTIEGLTEFRRELRKLDDRDLRRGMTKIHRDIAILVKARAQAAAPGDVKRSIGRRATQAGAFLVLKPNPPRAFGVFFGAKRRFGWYRAGRYEHSAGKQFDAWVGNQWDPGETGAEPYYIGPAINRSIDEVINIAADGIEDLARRAFPDGEHAN